MMKRRWAEKMMKTFWLKLEKDDEEAVDGEDDGDILVELSGSLHLLSQE